MTGHVLIAGGGIGGLTAALALHARGIDVTVVDRTDLRPLGVGINLLPHAVRELTTLGLGHELSAISVAPAALGYYDSRGTLLFTEPRGIDGGYGHPQCSVHRGRLHAMLLSAVRNRLGHNAVRSGTAVTRIVDTGPSVRVWTSAGQLVTDLLVGADGIHSAVRRHLHPGPDPLLWSGVRMFRGAVRADPFLDGRTMAIIKADNGIELVAYPIGGGQVNWVVLLPGAEPGPLPGDARWNSPGERDEVLRHLEQWDLGWLDAAGLVRRTDTVLEYPMVDREPLARWGRGRITLLGDAAHPMYPVGANGGSQAIVDAAVLAEEISHDFACGLERYESRRRSETADVVAANRAMHAAGTTRSPGDIARITATYRTDTHADRSHA
jgi:5-methylphenazine-1-carboxylate 1-monooxygenase